MTTLILYLLFQALQRVVLYLILAEYNNEQSDMLARVKADSNLAKLPYYQLVTPTSPNYL